MQSPPLLKIELALKEKTIQTYTFTQDRVVIGRDPDGDIFIDNSGVSRAHTSIEWVPGATYIVKDMGSTNGTFLNERSIRKEPLRSNDLITLGKFTLRVTIEDEDSGQARHAGGRAVDDFEGTTVLSADQMKRMMAKVEIERQAAKATAPAPQGSKASQAGMPISQMVIGGILVLILGMAIGIGFFILR